jgi:S1-C subfamily serine protease
MQEETTSAQNNLEQKLKQLRKAKNKKKIIIASVLVLFVIGYFITPNILAKFNKKEVTCLKNQTEIYEKYKNAVVLVKHTYAFEISIKGSKSFVINSDQTGLMPETITGTGFFVSENGKIVTNHHVAEPWLYGEEKQTSEDFIKDRIVNILPDSINEQDYKSYIEKNWNKYEENDGEEPSEPIAEAASKTINETENDSLQNQNNQTDEPSEQSFINENKEIKYVSLDDIKIIPKTIEISVALHGSKDDWLICRVLKVANGDEVDIGVLQLISEKLPNSVSTIIDLKNAILDDTSIKPGTNAILIGYPMGLTLANTRKGIKVQVYKGEINKESDGISIQYNVTSTHGASGSPVFNDCGQLIAVNYAGYDDAQGYNFGIVAKHALKLAD